MTKQRDVLIEHVSDGIREYDNPMPMWWLGIFWVSIAFAIFLVPYQALSGWTQEKQYDEEVAEADAQYAPLREKKAAEQAAAQAKAAKEAGVGDPAMVEAGKAIFAANCVACHGADATGGIGPNLTDSEWIHGGTLPEITNTVTNGVVEKGMIPWGPVLGEEKVAQVAAYVLTLSMVKE